MGKNRPNSKEYRKIYESVYGKIPEGYHIHHKDGNCYNNNIDNLECLSPEEHAKIHENNYTFWANIGGKLGGNKCVIDRLGWFNKSEEEKKLIRDRATIASNTKEGIEKRKNTYKKRYEQGLISHWSTLYSKKEVSEKIKSGDPGKSRRGKEAWNTGKKMKLENIENINLKKSISALNRKKYPCENCGKLFDPGNLVRHNKACKNHDKTDKPT
jgi:hypothetical protein